MRERESRPHPRARNVRTASGWWRIALALLELAAIIGNFRYVLGFSTFGISNFFAYFTIQTAIATVPTLAAAGVIALRGAAEPRLLTILRTIVLTHLVLSGTVFGIILAQAYTRDVKIGVPWSDVVLHFIMPAAVLLDWLADRFLAPRTPPLPWLTLAWCIPFPAVWLVFTIIRGDAVGWYPYFFLDPAQTDGPLQIAAYCAIVLVMMVTVTAVLVGLSRLRVRHPVDDLVLAR